MIYDGLRFQATCTMAGKPYGQPFGVDVGFSDPILGAPDVVTAEDRLGFAGITPPTLRLYPIETHIAEKLHAYTLPRARPNSRLKDLPDLALLAGVETARVEACARGARTNLRLPQDSRPARGSAGTSCPLGGALRRDGSRGPARVGHARGRDGGRARISGSSTRRQPRPDLGPGWAGLGTSLSQGSAASTLPRPIIAPGLPRRLQNAREGLLQTPSPEQWLLPPMSDAAKEVPLAS